MRMAHQPGANAAGTESGVMVREALGAPAIQKAGGSGGELIFSISADLGGSGGF